MAYTGLPPAPEGFTSLAEAWNHPLPDIGQRHNCNVIGVCVDFLECAKSRGTDYTMKLTLHDPYFTDGIGMKFQLFFKEEASAPAIKNQGDVVIFRNAGTFHSPKCGKLAMSNHATTWAVIEHASLSDSSDDLSNVIIHRSVRDGRKAEAPSLEQIKYAKAILALEDSTQWLAPARSTALQINATIAANGGTARPFPTKSRLVSDLEIPFNNRQYVDLTVEVRRTYETDMRLELSVTDYTENQHLYDYVHGTPDHEPSFDPGDPYGYTADKRSWPGPWGKKTLTVVLWEPHRTFALKKVGLGAFVNLRNVHIKMDNQGAKLEGVLHGDHLYPDKILVSPLRSGDARSNNELKELLRRKCVYEEHCKQSGLLFIRDADPAKLKKTLQHSKAQIDGPALEPEPGDRKDTKVTKNRKKKEKQRARAAAKAATSDHPEGEARDTATSLAPNAHVRTNASPASLIRIDEILNPVLLSRTTPQGNEWYTPFQNCRYKSRVKVIDYYPRQLEQFCVKVKQNQYAELSDSESVIEDESTDNDSDVMDVDSSDEADNKAKWEWRFALVIEDATPGRRNRTNDGELPRERRQLDLFITGQDADYLLREEACNLRKNAQALARLKEKLFVLWGNLQETAEEQNPVEGEGEGAKGLEQQPVKLSSQPFECFIAEYGVQSEGTDGTKMEHWERHFKMIHTTIA